MKKWKICLAFLLLAAVLAGCRKEQQETAGYKLYYVDDTGIGLVAEDYTPKAQGGDELIQELVAKLGDAPGQPSHKKAVPDGIGITSAVRTERSLRVDFNGTYHTMDNITEVFCRAAVVKTLVQVPEVDTVEFTVNGQELADSQGNPIGVMSQDSFIDNQGNGINSYQYAALVLYFGDESGKKLEREVRSLHYSSNEALEQVVLGEVIRGPKNTGLASVVPTDLKILGVSTEDNLCTVNLGKRAGEKAESSVSPKTALYAMVNALCENCPVEQVQFTIEGNSMTKFLGKADISEPFTKNVKLLDTTQKEKAPGVGVDPALQDNQE